MEYWKIGSLSCIALKNIMIALGSYGEFHCCYVSCKQADQITAYDYERLDQLHYKVENELLKLIESLQKKQKNIQWEVMHF